MAVAEGLGELVGVAAGDPVGVGVLEKAVGDVDTDGEPSEAVPPHALASRARTHTICPFLTVLPVVTPERWFGYAAIHKRMTGDSRRSREASRLKLSNRLPMAAKHHQGGSK